MSLFVSPLFDGVAKYILASNEALRNYILSALSGLVIVKSEPLDEHLCPYDSFRNLREFLNSKALKDTCADFSKFLAQGENARLAERFHKINEFASYYHKELGCALPAANKDSQVDFFCRTDSGYITIEFQLTRNSHWDDRALAYLAYLYGSQIKRGQKWESGLEKTIGINLLGKSGVRMWDTHEYRRHYCFQNMYNHERLWHMELIQYSISDLDFSKHTFTEYERPLRDVLKFFKDATTLKEWPHDIDHQLLEGYKMIENKTLKGVQPKLYHKQSEYWLNLGDHDDDMRMEGRIAGHIEGLEKGREEGKKDMALKLLKQGLDEKMIELASGLSTEEIEILKRDL